MYLSVVSATAAEEIAAIGTGRIFVANASRCAEDPFLWILDAVIWRFVDVDQVRFAQTATRVVSLSFGFRRRLLFQHSWLFCRFKLHLYYIINEAFNKLNRRALDGAIHRFIWFFKIKKNHPNDSPFSWISSASSVIIARRKKITFKNNLFCASHKVIVVPEWRFRICVWGSLRPGRKWALSSSKFSAHKTLK